jgi:site-specific DNA-methyltransferase (adenine-specific)
VIGQVHHGDCLALLMDLPMESVDLVYLDPPFFSGRDFGTFDDRWKGGMSEYLAFMRERLVQLHRVLKPTGSLYLHCDDSAAAYLRVALDDIFGVPEGDDASWSGLQNVIAWKRTSAHSSANQRGYGKVTDTIFFYVKGPTHTWNSPMIRAGSPATDRSDDGWAVLFGHELVPVGDVWTDIGVLNNQSKERTGYQTQKPVALLERILAASSNPGDVVLDPFCGSGTTVEAAERLGRRWIGMDTSAEAVAIARRRTEQVAGEPKRLFEAS